ncbi:MAG: M1 family metallopeptidase [Polyangiaceae bacterium]|nr:M1 family metallopeptidase [Polyangiaceae bacterium]
MVATLLLARAAPPTAPLAGAAPNRRPDAAAELVRRAPTHEPTRTGLVVPPVLSYDITARLDERRHVVDARAGVQWTNASSLPARELWIHLYLNAFANARTLFMRAPASSRRTAAELVEAGGITVYRLSAREFAGRDLWRDAARHSPGDPADRTDIRVPLPEAVAPGHSLHLDIEWAARLPRLVERTGYVGDFFAVAQWFPKIARLKPDGTWAHFAFHPLSEFSADFGNYTVTVDIPAGFSLAATGHPTRTRTRPGRRIVTSQARGVHDFAWVAWGSAIATETHVAGVRVDVLSPRGHPLELEQTLATVRRALPFYEQHFGIYPYPALHVVIPPDDGRAAGGMEYPTLILTGGPWYAPYVGLRSVQTVTAHELAHQWFYGLAANDENAWPFLDEGLASYAESEWMQRAWGNGSTLHLPWIDVSTVAKFRTAAVEYGRDEPIAQPADQFDSLKHLGALAYWRTSTLLRTLGNVYGRAHLEQALGSYAREQRGRHPNPEALIGNIRQHLGNPAASNLRKALFERGWVDYSIDRIAKSDSEHGGTTHRVVVRRRGTLTFPVPIRLTTSSGLRKVELWDGLGTSHTVESVGEPIVSAVVDPEHGVLLDENLLNNAAVQERRFPWRSLECGLSLAELVLLGLGP